jgi:hypothetical protein
MEPTNRTTYFRITELVFLYNMDTQFLDAQFNYVMLTPMWEPVTDSSGQKGYAYDKFFL